MGEFRGLWAGDREISEADMACIQTCMRRYGSLPRAELIHTVCVYMDRRTPAGETKFSACKKLLEKLEPRGEVVLPARDPRGSAPRVMRSLPGMVAEAREAVTGRLGDLSPVRLEWLDGDPEVEHCHAYLWRFHPLGYRKPFGYGARYRIASGAHDLGHLLFAGPARAIEARDRWMGWGAPQRRMNLPWVVNNQRFLIFPWVSVKDLASHVLGQVASRLPHDWQARWLCAAVGDFCGSGPLSRHLLSRGRLVMSGRDQRAGTGAAWTAVQELAQTRLGQAAEPGIQDAAVRRAPARPPPP